MIDLELSDLLVLVGGHTDELTLLHNSRLAVDQSGGDNGSRSRIVVVATVA